MSLDLNLNNHPLNPQLSNLHTCSNWAMTWNVLFEVASDHLKSLLHVDVVAADCVDVLPRKARVDLLQGFFDILEGDGYLFLNVGCDVSAFVPAALARCFDHRADFDSLRIVERF